MAYYRGRINIILVTLDDLQGQFTYCKPYQVNLSLNCRPEAISEAVVIKGYKCNLTRHFQLTRIVAP